MEERDARKVLGRTQTRDIVAHSGRHNSYEETWNLMMFPWTSGNCDGIAFFTVFSLVFNGQMLNQLIKQIIWLKQVN